MITWENYEEYMMMHADGELNPMEEQALMAFVAEHPELKKELAAYSMTKLVPDNEIVFEQKQQLFRQEESKRVIAFPVWQRYSIAAGVAAILFISFFKLGNKTDNSVAIKTDTINNITAPTPNTPMPQSGIAAVQGREVKEQGAKKNDIAAVVPVKAVVVKQTMAHQTTTIKKNEKADMPVASVKNTNPINEIHPSGIKALPYNSVAAATPAEREVPALPEAVSEEEQKKSFFDRLPIDDFKKQNIQHMATALVNGVDRVNTIKEEINETSITVKVQKRKLIVSF